MPVGVPSSLRSLRVGLRARTAAAVAIGGLVVSVTLGFLAYELARAYLLDKRLDLARREALLNARFTDAALAEEPAALRAVLSDVSEQSSPVLVESGGRWFGTVVGVGERDVPAELRQEVDDGHAAVHIGRDDDLPVAVVGVPLPRSGTSYYQRFTMVELSATLEAIRNALVIAAAVTTAGSAVLGLVISRRVMRPLRSVARTAERITDGDLEARLQPEGDPDLAPLMESFNEMADALESRIERERRFAADVSHELRTPLTALSSAVHVIDRRAEELSGPGRQAVDVLHKQVDQFTRLVLEILDLSRLEAGTADVQLESVDLRNLLRVVAAEMDLSEDVLHVDPDLPERVLTDPRRLRVMVRNLVENADRYAGGCTRLGALVTPSGWALEVDDRGPGVDETERQQLFERFRRGTAAAAVGAPKGTGLGLSLVWENARALGGSATVVDPPHPGARFRLDLPLQDGVPDPLAGQRQLRAGEQAR